MNKPICFPGLAVVLITCLSCFGPVQRAAAQQITIYGKFDWGTYSTRGVAGSIASGKGSYSGTIIQGNLVQGTYKITNASSTTGLLPGVSLSGAGVPANAVITDVNGTTISLSKMITAASATGVSLSISNGNATLATAHANGLGGSLPGFATCLLDSGIHYIFNGATTAPFPEQANAYATTIYAGRLTINANTSINKKQVYIADTLSLLTGHLTIPPADSLIITSGLPIAGSPFSSTKHIITSVNPDSNSAGLLGVRNISAAYLFPVGTADHYLPATLEPLSNAAFLVGAFAGITTNSQPGGTAFTQAQKATVVDAVWTIVRTGGNADSCQLTLSWPPALEGDDFSMADSIGIAPYDTAWQAAAGMGDNTANTAHRSFTAFSAFSVGNTGCSPGALRAFMPAVIAAKQPEDRAPLLISRIYPNPVSALLLVEHALPHEPVVISIYDLSGRTLYTAYSRTRRTTVPVTTLKPGLYILSLSDGINRVSQSFYKQ